MDAMAYAKETLPKKQYLGMDIRPGDTVRVHERVTEGNKERVAIFEGLVIGRRHGEEPGATITVRRISKGVGIERVFPLAMPALEKIEITRRASVRRAKLNYLRALIGKKATLRGELLPPGFGQAKEEETEAEAAAMEDVAVQEEEQEAAAAATAAEASAEEEAVSETASADAGAKEDEAATEPKEEEKTGA
jgi:large subunit ribosomal protein L19